MQVRNKKAFTKPTQREYTCAYSLNFCTGKETHEKHKDLKDNKLNGVHTTAELHEILHTVSYAATYYKQSMEETLVWFLKIILEKKNQDLLSHFVASFSTKLTSEIDEKLSGLKWFKEKKAKNTFFHSSYSFVNYEQALSLLLETKLSKETRDILAHCVFSELGEILYMESEKVFEKDKIKHLILLKKQKELKNISYYAQSKSETIKLAVVLLNFDIVWKEEALLKTTKRFLNRFNGKREAMLEMANGLFKDWTGSEKEFENMLELILK